MADVYQRVSAVGAAVQQLWKEFSGSTYHVRVMGSVLLNSTGGEPGSTAVPVNVQGVASTAVLGVVIQGAASTSTRWPVVIQSSTGGEGGSTALPLYVVGTGSSAFPIYVLGTITANQGTTGATAWPVSLAALPALAASTAIIGSLYPSTAVVGHVIGNASTAITGGNYDAGPIWATKHKITNSSDMSAGALITNAPTTTLKIRITDLLISPDGAMSITLREETTGTTGTIVGGPYYLSADSVVQITTRGDMWGASSDGPAADKAIQAVASTSGYVTLEAWWKETTA